MQKNKSLIGIYNTIYKKGEQNHYAKYIGEKSMISMEEKTVLKAVSFKDKIVLDAGCGSGFMCEAILKKGAKKVVGVDYSPEGILRAQKEHTDPRLSFVCSDLMKHTGKYDVVVSLGTLEHMDDPLLALKHLKSLLRPGGKLVLTCPNWSNPRGHMLLTLYFLFKAPITLADLNYLTPVEFEGWAKTLKMKLSWSTFDHNWSQGEKLVKDFERRITNVLRDAKLPNKKDNITEYLKWIEGHVLPLSQKTKWSGALACYVLEK